MESRIAKLEASLEHAERDIGEIKGDLRGMRNWNFTMFLFLLGALTGGFFWLAEKLDAVSEKITSVQVAVASQSAPHFPPAPTRDPRGEQPLQK